jgi:hypothetical protein
VATGATILLLRIAPSGLSSARWTPCPRSRTCRCQEDRSYRRLLLGSAVTVEAFSKLFVGYDDLPPNRREFAEGTEDPGTYLNFRGPGIQGRILTLDIGSLCCHARKVLAPRLEQRSKTEAIREVSFCVNV